MDVISPDILARINTWLTPIFDIDTQQFIKNNLATNPQALQDAFYKDLEFGTGGMRGIMGIGTNRINNYTLGKNTQGISNHLKQEFPNQKISVAIAYDCRHNSKALAQTVANVFSANGIEVFLFEDLRPTPELSFAVKQLNCQCGIVLTASHNPPEYNGYKVYWQDGGQIVPPQDRNIINTINAIDYADINFKANPSLIQYIGEEIDNAFISASISNGSFNTPTIAKRNLSIVFTPLHGTSVTIIPKVLTRSGYSNLHIVTEQEQPDGDFPTVVSPNPEEPEALKLAIDKATSITADIVIGTDPDCDRLGIAVRNLNGSIELLNGNQSMMLMLDFLLQQWESSGDLKGKEFIASTIVSTPMIQPLAAAYNVDCKLGLTGFKWIAKMIIEYPELQFIGGGEESFGFMVGDFVRDKDAVTATLLACEMAAQAKSTGTTLFKQLIELYIKHGFYKERLISLTKKGIEGEQAIKQLMINARKHPPTSIANSKVILIEDYQTATAKKTISGEETPIISQKSNVLMYHTQDGSRVGLRPSGTEPKIKYYISVNLPLNSESDYVATETLLDKKIDMIIKDLKLHSES